MTAQPYPTVELLFREPDYRSRNPSNLFDPQPKLRSGEGSGLWFIRHRKRESEDLCLGAPRLLTFVCRLDNW